MKSKEEEDDFKIDHNINESNECTSLVSESTFIKAYELNDNTVCVKLYPVYYLVGCFLTMIISINLTYQSGGVPLIQQLPF